MAEVMKRTAEERLEELVAEMTYVREQELAGFKAGYWFVLRDDDFLVGTNYWYQMGFENGKKAAEIVTGTGQVKAE
jgi:hypothetical protein